MSQRIQIGSNIESSPTIQARATPVRPAIWMTSVLAWATVVAIFLHVPTWAGIFLCCLTGLSFLSYLVPYMYLMVHDREALRRERISIKGTSAKQLVSVDTAQPLMSSETANERRIEEVGSTVPAIRRLEGK